MKIGYSSDRKEITVSHSSLHALLELYIHSIIKKKIKQENARADKTSNGEEWVQMNSGMVIEKLIIWFIWPGKEMKAAF